MFKRCKEWLHFFGVTFFILGILVLIFAGFMVGTHFIETSKTNDSKADGFTIEYYEVNLDVTTKNKIHVTENIGINFYEPGHHGIFRFVPEWLKYTSKDGKTRPRRGVITELRCENEDYEVDTVSGKQRVKIGSAYETLEPGIYEYVISYDYDMGGDIYKGFDEFIFHTFGDYWGTEINGAKVTIELPKKIDSATSVSFFADKKRKNDITSYVDYTVDDHTITAQVSEDYNLKGALTVDVELPDGFFADAQVNYKTTAFVLSALCLVSLLVSCFFWNKNKDSDLFDKDDISGTNIGGLEAVEMGYIYGGSGQLLLITVIIQLATKGYIRIKNPSSKKKLTLQKVNKSEVALSDAERLVYDGLFKNGNEVIPAQDTRVRKLNSKLNKMLEEKFDSKIYNIASYVEFMISSLLFFLSSLEISFAYIRSEDMDPTLRWFFLPAFLAVIATGFFAAKTPKKSAYGEELIARVEAYKNYLSAVKKQDLEAKIDKDHDYFDEVLPYAFIFGISKKLLNKYDYTANATNRYIKYTDNITSSVYYTDTSTSSSSSSSSSGCGGGCSSCGGGCSSCGGGGSW